MPTPDTRHSPRSSHVYGPVPSRRLGRSLGVDVVPFKVCSYDCVYCQLGRTTTRTVARREWVDLAAIQADLAPLLASAEGLDFVTVSGSGEPTLHSRLGELIRWIRARTRVPVAVITNGSLLWRPEVRDELADADLVVPSLDAADAASFHAVNRPHRVVDFERMVDGLLAFAAEFHGRLWLEVLLLDRVTGSPDQVAAIARLARQIGPERVHLGTVTRPPAESFAHPVPAAELCRLSRLFDPPAEVVVDRPNGWSTTGGRVARERVLELLRRRPCTLQDVAHGLGTSENEVVKLLDRLMAEGAVIRERRRGRPFYRASRTRETRA